MPGSDSAARDSEMDASAERDATLDALDGSAADAAVRDARDTMLDSAVPTTDAGLGSDGGPPSDAGLDAPLGDALPRADAGEPSDSGSEPCQPFPTPPAASHLVSAEPFDAVLDSERHRVFLSQGLSGTVEVLHLSCGTVDVVTTGYRAEHMYFEPVRDEVVVSLPIADHANTWWTADQEGYVTAIDAADLSVREPIWIPSDPWTITANGAGLVYVSSGSGQWTRFVAANLLTAEYATHIGDHARQRSNIALHPDGDRIYALGTDSSGAQINRYDVSEMTVTIDFDDRFGLEPNCRRLRMHPTGSLIYTGCGHVFRTASGHDTDGEWAGQFEDPWPDGRPGYWMDLAFHPSEPRAYITRDYYPAIAIMDTDTLGVVRLVETPGWPGRVLTAEDYLVVLSQVVDADGDAATEVRLIPYEDL